MKAKSIFRLAELFRTSAVLILPPLVFNIFLQFYKF